MSGTTCSVCGVQRSVKGQEVFDKVCEHLTIANNERDYFACSFKDDKKIRVSICSNSGSVKVFHSQMVLRPTYPYQLPRSKASHYGRDFVPYCIFKKF